MSRGILEAALPWVIHSLQSRAWHSLGEDRTSEHEACCRAPSWSKPRFVFTARASGW